MPQRSTSPPNSLLPPQSVEYEESLICGCLQDKECCSIIVDALRPEDYYRSAHQKIIQVITDLYNEGLTPDLLTTVMRLKELHQLEDIGGAIYLASLMDTAPYPANLQTYIQDVKDKSLKRSLLSEISENTRSVYDGVDSGEQLLDKFQQIITALDKKSTAFTVARPKDLIFDRLDKLEEVDASPDIIHGLFTGFRDLDEFTNGLQETDLVIIAARPSSGKTSLAMNMAVNMAEKRIGTAPTTEGEAEEKPPRNAIAVFSLEMSKEILTDRMIASGSRVSLTKFRKGRLTKDEWERISDFSGILTDLNIIIDDQPGLHYTQIMRRARRLKRSDDIKCVIVDHLQLARGDIENGRRDLEIKSITAAMKALAKELHIPVLVLCQLSRNLEHRNDKRPRLSDLRDSGAIEEDADVVMMLYLDELYYPDTEMVGVAEVSFTKQRNGPTGRVIMAFNRSIVSFNDLTKEDIEAYSYYLRRAGRD